MGETQVVLDSSHVRVTYETNHRQQQKNLNDLSGTSKTAQKRPKSPKRVIFKGDDSLDTLFSWLWERLKLFWTPHMSGYPMELIRDNEDFKGPVRNIKNGRKRPKG